MNDLVLLRLNNVNVGYKTTIVNNINAEIKKGEITLLIGKNGSGKTSLLKSIYKELPTIGGNIEIIDKKIADISFSEIGKFISIVLSKSAISSSLKVFDIIALGRYPYKKWYQKLSNQEINDIHNIIEILNLGEYKNYYAHELSDGNLQKTMIARAFIQDTPLLILDEPTSHLDIANKLEIMKLLKVLAKQKNKAILFTSHDLQLGLSIADKIWFIKNKSFFSGTTEDIALQENILQHFTNESIKFDYSSNMYQFINDTNSNSISVEGDSISIYWLKHALTRNNFLFSPYPNSDIRIYYENLSFIVIYKEEKYSFKNINDTLTFLNNI